MNNKTILLKVKSRLNKVDSDDFDNLASWQILEAFNKFQVDWCRQNAHGTNPYREGDESSTSRIQDLQSLLTTTPSLTFIDKGIYFEGATSSWPIDFLRFKRIELTGTNSCCSQPKRFTVYLGEESNVDVYLDDVNRRPNYNWGETFAVINGDKLQLYHNKEFSIKDCKLVYYRQPRRVQMAAVVDVYDPANTPTVDVEAEFSDDLIELFCDGAASVLAGDTENANQLQLLNARTDKDN